MSKKKAHHEEHVDETWLIPYADMLTLLLALFIVMFAMGQVDKEKLQSLSEQFNIIFSSGNGVLERQYNTISPTQMPSLANNNGLLEVKKMNEIKRVLDEEIERSGYAGKITVDLNLKGLEISIQDVVLFKSGDANILNEVSPMLLKIAEMLRGLENNIEIVGHTDNVAIHTKQFRSNWDLSAMRAINVMNYMVAKGGLRPEKYSIQAYGEYRPKADNSTAAGRTLNRRVEISIIRMYPIDEPKSDKIVPDKVDKKTK